MKQRTRISAEMDGRYHVQDLGSDNLYHTIPGGICETKEEAKRIRKAYKAAENFVNRFNDKFCGMHTIHLPKFEPCDYQKRDEEERDK
jgi:hypothetical protein